MVQPIFQFRCKNKLGKNVFAINRHTFPSRKQIKYSTVNTLQVSYSYTQNISQIIKRRYKNVTQIKLECNCRIKTECALDHNRWKEDIFKYTALTTFQPKKWKEIM